MAFDWPLFKSLFIYSIWRKREINHEQHLFTSSDDDDVSCMVMIMNQQLLHSNTKQSAEAFKLVRRLTQLKCNFLHSFFSHFDQYIQNPGKMYFQLQLLYPIDMQCMHSQMGAHMQHFVSIVFFCLLLLLLFTKHIHIFVFCQIRYI